MRVSPALFLALVMSLVPLAVAQAPVPTHAVAQLTTNGRTDPLGIAADDLSFGWAMTSERRGVVQKAYQIRVGTTAGGSEVWDSGRVESDRQLDIRLPADRAVKPATRYQWQVKTWDGDDRASEWSEPAWFETGLLSQDDWAGAHWITRPTEPVRPEAWTDYTVTVVFSVESEAFGVLLRSSVDGRNAYLYQINLTGDRPTLKPHKRVNGAYIELARVDLAPFGFSNDALRHGTHTLVLDVRGNTVTTTLDGKQVDRRTDDTFRHGLIGFRTNGRERGTVHRVTVVDAATGEVKLEPAFAKGEHGFSNGTIVDGRLPISGNTDAVYVNAPPSLPLFRNTFRARGEVKRARLYASAQGIYDVSVNGTRAGDQYLAPGWTDYHQRIQHQTYDVTDLVKQGDNAIGAALADGWHRGNVGISWTHVYGDTLGFIARLKVEYADGSVEWFNTDDTWRASGGPFVRADLQDGEIYDAHREQRGWDTTSFDASSWQPVAILPMPRGKLVPQPDEPVRVLETLATRERKDLGDGRTLYDLGQNMVGVARVTMTGRKGQTATIRYGEEVYRTGERKGQLYTDNFRAAKVTDTYTFAADGVVTYQPTFTQHGFRYVEVSGLEEAPPAGGVVGIVLGSALPDVGDLVTSDAMLNQLVSNIRWGQRGNFLSIPTDTPARNERLGWTGDINVFAPTASRLQDTRGFLGKWMDDVRDAQFDNGDVPAVVPQPRGEFKDNGLGWSDAVITVPYAVWHATGDPRIVRRNWDAMQRFYRFMHDSATRDGNLIEEGRSSWFSGDWLTLEKVERLEEHKVIATAYFAKNTRMMAEMAAAMGDTAKAAEWHALVPRIREAFVATFRKPDGSIYTGTQTAYALALGMNMIADAKHREQTAARYIEKLAADDNHLRTGFLGTPWLLPALTAIDRPDLAMRLLLNDTYPSWGFEVRMGATTVWERWNTIRPDGTFGPVDMNSFNHYAYGAVGDWMFAHVGGLQALEPGYKRSRIAPLIGHGGLTSAKAHIRTPAGLLSSDWRIADDTLTLSVTVPPNTTAEVVLPAASVDAVQESGTPAATAAGVVLSKAEAGRVTLGIGSGEYTFTAPAVPSSR